MTRAWSAGRGSQALIPGWSRRPWRFWPSAVLGLADHPRVKAGIKLILDRALDAGGWNYGNKSVFGTELRPQPGPTGLALLALAAGGDRSAAVARGAGLPARTLPRPPGTGLARLGHPGPAGSPRPSRRRPKPGSKKPHARCTGKPDAAMGLALLLLASSESAMSLHRYTCFERVRLTAKSSQLERTHSGHTS